MANHHLPRARTAHLRTSRGEDGALIVYDVEHDAGHVLNAAAAVVYELADGTRTVAEIAAQLGDRLGYDADADVVQLALDDLAEARMLEPTNELATAESGRGRVSRRDLMRRFALTATAAAVLPGLGSIDNLSRAVAPAPRLVGSSGQAGAGYYLQPFHLAAGYYSTGPSYGPTPRPYTTRAAAASPLA